MNNPIEFSANRLVSGQGNEEDLETIKIYIREFRGHSYLHNLLRFYFIIDWQYVFQYKSPLTVYDLLDNETKYVKEKCFKFLEDFFKTASLNKNNNYFYDKLGHIIPNFFGKESSYEKKASRHFKEFMNHTHQYFHNIDYKSDHFSDENRWVNFSQEEIDFKIYTFLNKLQDGLNYNEAFYDLNKKLNSYKLSRYFVLHLLLRHMEKFKFYFTVSNKEDKIDLVSLYSEDGCFPYFDPQILVNLLDYLTKKLNEANIKSGTVLIYVADANIAGYLDHPYGGNQNICNQIVCVEIENSNEKVIQSIYPMSNDKQLFMLGENREQIKVEILDKIINKEEVPEY
jgi:hypothetical protein